MKKKTYGFTLVELLVVILIIGILTAVAVPMYKHAVLKSRFSTVMSLAKSLAAAQEVYYLGNGIYSDNLAELDVSAVGNASGRSATLQDGTTVALGDTEVLKYVMTGKSDLSNHFIIYQKNSKYFPGEIHCEAQKENADANWLCEKGLSGTLLGERALTSGYNTYVIDGEGNGRFPMTVNVSNHVLDPGDSCYWNAASEAHCDYVTITDGECKINIARYSGGCNHGEFHNSVCDGVTHYSCQESIFTNSTCNAHRQQGCHLSSYDNSTCDAKDFGGCGHSTFTNNSVCYGGGTLACLYGSFKNGSVCYALHPDQSCRYSSYDSTSYCDGDYCPNNAPSGTPGKKWYRGTGDEWPNDRPSELVDK